MLIIGALMLFMGINPLDILAGGGGGGGQINMPQLPRAERPVAQRTPNRDSGSARVTPGRWPADRPAELAKTK